MLARKKSTNEEKNIRIPESGIPLPKKWYPEKIFERAEIELAKKSRQIGAETNTRLMNKFVLRDACV